MAVVNPKLALGIPIYDADFGIPDNSGLSKGWSAGSRVTGETTGLDVVVNDSTLQAYALGSGRSQRITIAADQAGDNTNDAIVSAASPPGMHPRVYGGPLAHNITFAVIHRRLFSGGSSVTWKLRQYNSSDTLLLTTTLATYNQSESAFSLGTADVSISWQAATSYVRIIAVFDSNSGAGGGRYEVDQVALGFVPGQSGALDVGKLYSREGFDVTYRSAARRIGDDTTFADRVVNTEGGRKALIWTPRWWNLDVTQWQRMLYFWEVSKGTPLGGDEPAGVPSGHLRGHLWPLMVLPGRNIDNIKSCFYGRVDIRNFGGSVQLDQQWLPDPMPWRVQFTFDEVFY